MKVEIWSDVVCPWCYIGKRRFEAALADFEHADAVEVVWRSFELDPDASPHDHVDLADHLAGKYGTDRSGAIAMMDRVTEAAASVGLDYRLEIAIRSSTFDAHRVLHLAAAQGLGNQMKERLMLAYFCEGADVAEHQVLAQLGGEIGLDRAATAHMLGTDAFAEEVRHDQAMATELGVRGVPFFVIDRAYALSGAQDPAAILDALREAWAESTDRSEA